MAEPVSTQPCDQCRRLAEQIVDLKRRVAGLEATRAERVPLPAQMEELRGRLTQIREDAGAPGDELDAVWIHQKLDEILRLIPVQHDDQVGGKPVEPGR